MTTLLMMLLFLFLGKVCPARIQLSPTSKDDVSPDRQVLVDVAGYGEDKISTVLVTGSVLCDLDRHGNGGRVTSQPVPGAIVSLHCSISSLSMECVTDDSGDFTIDVPSHLHAIPDFHNKCILQLVHLPNNFSCHCAYSKQKKAGIRWPLAPEHNNKDGVRTYSVGTIRLQHPRTL